MKQCACLKSTCRLRAKFYMCNVKTFLVVTSRYYVRLKVNFFVFFSYFIHLFIFTMTGFKKKAVVVKWLSVCVQRVYCKVVI